MTTSGATTGAANIPNNLDEIVASACRRVGLRTGSIRLLRHFANAVYLIEDQDVVARVAYGDSVTARSRLAVTITRWLVDQGFAASEPAEVDAEQPIVCDDHAQEVAVSFWRYYPQPADRPKPTLDLLGHLARDLHRIDAPPPVPLPTYDPLRSMRRAVADDALMTVTGVATTLWLRQRIDELIGEYEHLDFPLGTGVIHGDVYAGNLLWNDDLDPPVVLGDWDSVSIGPREIDLAPTFTAARFGLSPASLDQFAESYGHDLRMWAGYPTLRAIREISTLSALIKLAPTKVDAATQLDYRLTTLQEDNRTAIRQIQ